MLVNMIGKHFSSSILCVSEEHKNVCPLIINVNKMYPIKYKGKPILEIVLKMNFVYFVRYYQS